MSEQPSDQPYSDTHLESPAYRERLRRKLECLIAVLEVAVAKVQRTLDAPGSDRERLTRIQKNLRDTLTTCERARTALDRKERMPADLDRRLAALSDEKDGAAEAAKARLSRTDFVSTRERMRFVGRTAIAKRDVTSCDLEQLARRLQG